MRGLSSRLRKWHFPVATGLALMAFTSIAGAQVDPATVDATLAPGESIVVNKTVHTPEIPPNPDIVFLADTTGSMGGAIANVEANAATILSTIAGSQPTAQFAVAEYRDIGDAFVYQVTQDLTSSQTDTQNAITAWTASGGGDTPEAQLIALLGLATGDISFRADSTRVIVWFGDAPGHEAPEAGYPSRAAVIAALNAADITVIAVNVGFGGLDSTGQATDITTATGGSLETTATDVADAILAGLGNLPITVFHSAACDPGLLVSLSPASQTVTSGDDALFTETIEVAADPSLAGSTLTCVVTFADGLGNVIGTQSITIDVPIAIDAEPETATNELGTPGQTHTVDATVTSGAVLVPDRNVTFDIVSGPNAPQSATIATDASGVASFTYVAAQGPAGLGQDLIVACVEGTLVCDRVTKDWVDTTPPVPACDETVNPHGKTTPPAGSTTLPGAKGGQNEDGFYLISATDAVYPSSDLEIFVLDTGSGTVFGPYASGTVIKYTESPDGTPEAKKIGSDNGQAGAVEVHIIGTGDAAVYASDPSGNVSDPVSCLVPPLPK